MECWIKSHNPRIKSSKVQNLEHVGINRALVDLNLSPRLNQILVPLLSIIEDDGIKNDIRNAIQGLENDLRAEKSATPEGELLSILAELINGRLRTSIPLAEMTTLFIERHGVDYYRSITNRYIGYLLRKRLRLHPHKSHGVYVVPLSEKSKIEALCVRYGISRNSSDDAEM